MNLYRQALDELGTVMDRIDDEAVDTACRMIARANRITLYACGREGLQLRGFCMRLFHMGRDVHMVGDMTTPPVGPGDRWLTGRGPRCSTRRRRAGLGAGPVRERSPR